MSILTPEESRRQWRQYWQEIQVTGVVPPEPPSAMNHTPQNFGQFTTVLLRALAGPVAAPVLKIDLIRALARTWSSD